MKPFVLFILSICALLNTYGQSTALPAREFYNAITGPNEKAILDVRTPEEYASGHIAGSANINWNDSAFAARAGLLPKDKPVYVYCLSGGRSAKAAAFLRNNGFKQVYELEGGLMKWRAAKLPEEAPAGRKDALTKAEFDKALNTDKLVLVDFYADWCVPCKKMEPYLKEIATEQATTVTVLRIDADRNQELAKTLGVDALPVLHIYRNKALQWSHQGYISKEKVLAQLNKQQ